MSETKKQLSQLDKSSLDVILTACEYGWNSCEKGRSLEMTMGSIKEILSVREVKDAGKV